MSRIRRFSLRPLVVAGVLALTAAAASARPFTALLDPLEADLEARLAVVAADPGAAAQRRAIEGALRDLTRVWSYSAADDVRILKLVAKRVEPLYAQDPAVLTGALVALRDAIAADRAAALLLADDVFDAAAETSARDLLDRAEADLDAVLAPPPRMTSVAARCDLVARAAKSVRAARAKIERGSNCAPKRFGFLRAVIDGRPDRPPVGYAEITVEPGVGPIVEARFASWWYDRRRESPYERGTIDVVIDGAVFNGVGTYQVGAGAHITHTAFGATWVAASGTVEITAYDTTHRIVEGTFSGALEEFRTGAAQTITGGRFRFCNWKVVEATISTKD